MKPETNDSKGGLKAFFAAMVVGAAIVAFFANLGVVIDNAIKFIGLFRGYEPAVSLENARGASTLSLADFIDGPVGTLAIDVEMRIVNSGLGDARNCRGELAVENAATEVWYRNKMTRLGRGRATEQQKAFPMPAYRKVDVGLVFFVPAEAFSKKAMVRIVCDGVVTPLSNIELRDPLLVPATGR